MHHDFQVGDSAVRLQDRPSIHQERELSKGHAYKVSHIYAHSIKLEGKTGTWAPKFFKKVQKEDPEEIKVGDTVECIRDNGSVYLHIGHKYVVKSTDALHYMLNGMKPKGEKEMNANIAKVFEKTADALLVEKHLGNQFNEFFMTGLEMQAHKDAILSEAKRKEAKEQANKK